MAVAARRPRGVEHHSDKGSQYTTVEFGERSRELGVRLSTGSVGICFDNAMAESFCATLEKEMISKKRFASRYEASQQVFAHIEGFYNTRRKHTALNNVSPRAYERWSREEGPGAEK